MLKILLFNLLFMILEILIYAGDFLNPEQKLLAGVLSIIVFWSVNYYFLKILDRKKFSVNPRTVQDYEKALKYWLGKSGAFQEELKTAVDQLAVFSRKQKVLQGFPEQNAMFRSVSQDVELYLLQNFKKILNRMLILDLSEPGRLQVHKIYLCRILAQNQELLQQYENFMIEISQLGADESQMPCLELMTQALQELRSKEDFS